MSNGRSDDKYELTLAYLKGKISEIKIPKDSKKAQALTDLRTLISKSDFGEYGGQGRKYKGEELKDLFDAIEKLWKLSNTKLSQDKRMLGGILKVSRSKSKTSDAAEEILINLVDILKSTNFKYPEKIAINEHGQLDAKATIARMRHDLANPKKASDDESLKQSLEAMRRENADSKIGTSQQGLFSGTAAAAAKPQPSQSPAPKPGRKS